MRTAAILSIGDELITGQTVDTNSAWLSDRLLGLGFRVVEHRTVPDDREILAASIRTLHEVCDIVILTGGLGPTLDDLTREALGEVVNPGEPLVEDAEALRQVEQWFRRGGKAMPASNRRQAFRPRSGEIIENRWGTAPGLLAQNGDRLIVALPGPPRELEPMFNELVRPRIESWSGRETIATGIVRLVGLGESAAAERLGEMMDRDRNPLVGTTAAGGIVSARIRATGIRAEELVQIDLKEIGSRWAPYALEPDTSLPEAVIELLVRRGLKLVMAESCTGGLLASRLVDVPGSSRALHGGWVTYSNDMKIRDLGVPAEELERLGAVSAEVARSMALGALEHSTADVSLAVTGIAGPDGGGAEKPVGTVHLGLGRRLGRNLNVVARRFRFSGNRSDIRERAAITALQWLRLELLGHPMTPMLWDWPQNSAD